MRTLFGRGARGALIQDLQRVLVSHGIPLANIDGDFGGHTETAVRDFQSGSGGPATGTVSVDEWTALTGQPLPSLADRCLQVTSAFEGHDYTLAAGNWDGAWLTWGIIGFTLKAGRVQAIVRAVDLAAPGRVTLAFGPNAAALRDIVRGTSIAQKVWAIGISSSDGRRLVEPWQTAFARFGAFPEVQAAQRKSAFDDYFMPAVHTASALGLTSELGIALCFDIHVQNGGVSTAVRGSLPPLVPGAPERIRREAIANAVADHSAEKFRENVRKRKLAIATGAGVANGIDVVLANWGLAEVPAVV
jgi:peptidoglycan hydrolase-like protein with peptidoglycan-binding domain